MAVFMDYWAMTASREYCDNCSTHQGIFFIKQTITLKMADQKCSDIYVALSRSFEVVTFVFDKLQS